MKKLLSNLLLIISVLFLLWFGISYGEIICKNTSPNPKYSKNNIIVNAFKIVDNNYDYEN